MKKNILKKFIVLFSLGFILFGYNFVFADITPPSDQIITFSSTSPSDATVGGSTYAPTATSTSKLTVTFTIDSSASSVCSIDGSDKVSFNTAGSCVIDANQVGDSDYNSATQVQQSFTVGATASTPSDQIITFSSTSPSDATVGGSTYAPTATSTSKLTVTFTIDSSASSVCSIDGSDKVSFNTAGSCVIDANQVGDSDYNSATQVQQSFTVGIISNSGNNTTTHLNLTINVDVPSSCNATDTDGVKHTYPQSNSYFAICALESAISNGSIFSVQLSNQYPSMGLFITAINNTVANSNSQYWAILQNRNLAQLGITSLPVIAGDSIVFQLHDFSDNNLGDQVTLNIHSLISSVINSGGGGGGYIIPIENKIFSIQSALDFLYKKQNSNGSFNSPMYTDWVAISVVAGKNDKLETSIINYLKLNPINSSAITNYERRAMALMALGINPYNGTNVNYVNKIISSFDGVQIGDQSLVNDDIFGLIVLSNAGYTKNDEIIKNTISFIVKKQMSNGSWGSVDMTAAAIQSLSNYKNLNGVGESVSKGELYLLGEQKVDGSFGNFSSTSWAIQALSLNNSFSAQVDKANKNLAINQQADGGLGSDDIIGNRIWATSYAIPAALKLSWGNILESFSKEEIIPIVQDVKVVDLSRIEIPKTEPIAPTKIEEVALVADNKIDNIDTKTIKKEKIIKKKVNTKILEQKVKSDKLSNNLLVASAANSVQSNNNNTFISLIFNVFKKLSTPFTWLFIHLGF